MLGKFNYSIADNTFSTSPLGQGSITTTRERIHITGGSDVDMDATSIGASTYSVTSTVAADVTFVGPGAQAGAFRIKQLPQIIYLGRNDLYWFDQGAGQSTPVPLAILLDDANTTASKLTPDPYPLFSVTNKGAGESYNFTTTITAPLGYYWSNGAIGGGITGLPVWATITNITLASGLYPTTITISFSISSHPVAATTLTLNINTTSFISEAAVNITLNRTNSTHITSNLPELQQNVSYNFYTGATFTLVYTTTAYYYIQQNNPISGIIQPPTGGGTITVLNSVLSNNNTIITMTVKLSGLPLTGYLTTIPYTINVNDFSYAPLISYASGGFTQINQNFGSGLISETVTIENYTGEAIEISVWILQQRSYYSGINAVVTGQFKSLTGNVPAFDLVANAIALPSTSYGSYYSTRITLQDRTSVTGTFSRQPTADSSHSVYLLSLTETTSGLMVWSGDPDIVWP